MSRYQCVFFDLDHTLWDYETNSAESLQKLYHRYQLEHLGATSFPDFFKTFRIPSITSSGGKAVRMK